MADTVSKSFFRGNLMVLLQHYLQKSQNIWNVKVTTHDKHVKMRVVEFELCLQLLGQSQNSSM